MRSLTAIALSLGLGLSTVAAQAMPVGHQPVGGNLSTIQQAAYGCGPGMTRGPYGHCRPR
jgi:hypothetical protein